MLKLNTLAALAQVVPVTNPGYSVNLVAAIEDFTESMGEKKDKYLQAAPPPMMAPGLAPGAPGAPPPPPGGAPGVGPGAGGAPPNPFGQAA
jgi:hypothetical protein